MPALERLLRGAINGLTLTAVADGFTIAGGTTPRTLTISGSDVSINQSLTIASSPTFAGLTLSGLTADGVVKVASGVLSSEAQLAVARGGTAGTATPTAGALAYGTGTAYAFSLAGSASQVLLSGGTGSPTWSNIASLLTAGTNIVITGTTNATIATSATPSFTTVNGLTLTAAADGFTVAGGTTSRTLTITGSDVAINQNLQTSNSPIFVGLTLTGTLATSSQNALQLSPYGVAAGNTGEIRFLELAAGGTNYVGFKAADALAGNIVWTLPSAEGSANQALVTNGSGTLSWAVAGAPADATYVTLSLNSSLSAERVLTAGTNISITDAGANGTITVATTANPTFSTSVTTPKINLTDSTNQIVLDSDGTYTGTLTMDTLTTASKTWTLPNASGTLAVSAAAPITLSAAGDIGLAYNTTNLQITATQLNTIQDIATSSSPTFAGLTLSGLTPDGVVKVASGVLSSEAQLAIARGGTAGTATPTAGAVAYGTGTAYAFSAAGTSGQALLSGGSGSPTWGSIQQLIKDFTADTGETITAGDVVSFINGNVKKGFGTVSNIGFGSEYVFKSSDISGFQQTPAAAALSSTSFVVCYYSDKCKIGTVSGTTITFGSEYAIPRTGLILNVVAALSSTSFVVAYHTFSNPYYYGYAKIGTVSGTTITFGSEYSYATFYVGTYYNSIVALSSTSFVMALPCGAYTSTCYGTAIIGTVSGTTITFGSEYVFNAATTGYISAAMLSSTSFAAAYADSTGYGTAIIGTVSGTTISYGSEYVFNAATTGYISAAMLSSTSFAAAYADSTGYGTAIIGTVSGTTISYGSEYVFNAATTSYNSVAPLSFASFVVAYQRCRQFFLRHRRHRHSFRHEDYFELGIRFQYGRHRKKVSRCFLFY